MDLLEPIHHAFIKYKKDPKEYLEAKDKKKQGTISITDLRHMIFEYLKLGFTQAELDILVRRYEHATKKNQIDIGPMIEDLAAIKKREERSSGAMMKSQSSVYNPKTPIEGIANLKFSNRHPKNVPGYKSYSMKNTVCGRQGATKPVESIVVKDFESLLEEIMKQTFLNDKFVEDFFRQYTKHDDLTIDEFEKALNDLNLKFDRVEIEDFYDELKGRDKNLKLADIDAAVESTVKRNIEECQKLILDGVYSGLKSDPLLNFEDVFMTYQNQATNKVTFMQFVTTLEPKCLNIEPTNLLLLAKRYCTTYDDEVFYKDFLEDLEKLSKNVDPTKEWIGDV